MFYFHAGLSDWFKMKTKANVAIVQGLHFPRHETDIPTKEFVLSKMFFLLTNLFTPSFTLSLQTTP